MKNMFVFPAFKTNKVGVWYFYTDEIEKYKKKLPCKGFGQIKYAEGSIYTGDIYFDGKNYNKLGNGQQDFSNSGLGMIDTFINEKKYKFVGKYDYRKTDWIYGNGVIYYQDINNKPSHFVKGFYKGLDKIKEYQGKFDYSSLIDGYDESMEFDYVQRVSLFNYEKENMKKIDNINTLFIGDSYFEFWHYKEYAGKTFYERFKNCLNLGLGGTTFMDWIPFIDKLCDIQNVKNIIINLGFNDIHCNLTYRQVYNDLLKVLKLLRNYFPNSNYYLLNVVHAPLFNQYIDEENQYNELISRNSKKLNINILDNYSNIKFAGELNNCFHSDLVHLNEKGYEYLYQLIESEIDL